MAHHRVSEQLKSHTFPSYRKPQSCVMWLYYSMSQTVSEPSASHVSASRYCEVYQSSYCDTYIYCTLWSLDARMDWIYRNHRRRI